MNHGFLCYYHKLVRRAMSYEDQEAMNQFATFLIGLTPNEFTALACIIGFLLSQNLNAAAQQSAGNFFECVGQVMLTISGQNYARSNFNDPNNNFMN